MAGLVPAIHALASEKKGVDARHKAGHDDGVCRAVRAHDQNFTLGTCSTCARCSPRSKNGC
jgi:hypothetical protein